MKIGDHLARRRVFDASRSCWLLVILLSAAGTTAAAYDDREARKNEIPGWGRVFDPSRDCDVSLDRDLDRLKIKVPGTPHVLSAEVPGLPMNAPRVVRRVRGDLRPCPRARPPRAGPIEDHALRPVPRRRPDRLAGPVELPPAREGRRVYRRSASPLHQLRAARGGRLAVSHGIETRTVLSTSCSVDAAGPSPPGTAATAADGSSSRVSTRNSTNGSRSESSQSTRPDGRCGPSWSGSASRTLRARWPETMRRDAGKIVALSSGIGGHLQGPVGISVIEDGMEEPGS